MILFLLIGAALAGGAIALVARAVTMSRMRAADTLERIGGYGFLGHAGDSSDSRQVGTAVGEVAALMGNMVGSWFGKGREAQTRAALMAAGLYNPPPRKFMGY